MPKYDADQICSDRPLVDVISGYIKLKKNGNEFEACCPFHGEKTPSFRVVPEKGFYHCFGCGAHGDQIDFVMDYDQVDFVSACKILGGEKTSDDNAPKKRQSKKIDVKDPYEGITPIMPIPADVHQFIAGKKTPNIYNPKREKFTTYTPSMVFPYKNEVGELLGYVLRIDFGDDTKINPSIMWCKLPNGSETFCHYSFPEPRTLYGAEELPENKPIVITEGEKASDAAKRLLGMHYTCVAWSGGTQVVNKTDWSVLKGRRVLIMVDNDQPGTDCVLGTEKKKGLVHYLTEAGVESIKHTTIDPDKEKGWDLADAEAEGMSSDDVIEWAKKHIVEFNAPQPEQEHEPEPEPEEDYNEQPDFSEQYESNEEDKTDENNLPFRVLGFNRNIFYYLPDRSQQLVALSASQHTKNNLFAIASANHWEIEYPQKTGFDLDQAVNALIGRSYNKGLFDPHELLRGRGAWEDDGRAVLHLGSRCYVDGVETSPRNVSSKYIYENQSELSVKLETPATNKEAHKLVSMSESLSWENPLSAALMAGWCVVAPVCGILEWRPHIWVTGPSGSGKSTVLKNIISEVVGGMALQMEGNSTEAGVRQEISQDARPVVFDEAEAEDEAGARRMKSVLSLARVSSSGGKIIKGGQSGSSMSFSIRSCFCFSSINTSMKDYADESRINKLILRADKSDGAKDKYDSLDKEIRSTFNKEYSAKMLSRSVRYMQVLQHNCTSFIDAATRTFGSRRLADQIGTLLAGYYLCHSVKKISPEEAEEWMGKKDWTEHTDVINRQDEQRLLEYIVTRRIRTEDDKGYHDVSIGELILCASKDIDIISQVSADRELRRHGIIVDFNSVYIANNCQPMRELLASTAWSSDWSRPLKDLYHTEISDVKYFAPGIRSRAVELPLELFKQG